VVSADVLFTHVHGPEKAEVLRGLWAAVYVGDTPPDITAGISAGVRAIGVATGSFTAAELHRAGTELALDTLEAFPACYQGRGG
jgi:phosphoglycolate phosphatase-like HAD superfamily hydrolase